MANNNEEGGEVAIVRCGTTKGPIVMELNRRWSPHGYDRAVALFEKGFFDRSHFFRVVEGFLVQFGISYSSDADLRRTAEETIPDDPQLDPPIPFKAGTISYAGGGDDSRSSQMFVSYGDSESLGTQKWETPIGRVVEGYENVEKFYSYGDMPPWGKGPVQGKIHSGRAYIDENFPLTDSFETCQVERITDKAKHAGGGGSASHKSRQQQEQHEQREKRKQQQHEKHIRNEKYRDRHLHDAAAGSSGKVGDKANAKADTHTKKQTRGLSRHLDAVSVDAKIVGAAVVVLVLIWMWTRPLLRRTSKKDSRRAD